VVGGKKGGGKKGKNAAKKVREGRKKTKRVALPNSGGKWERGRVNWAG